MDTIVAGAVEEILFVWSTTASDKVEAVVNQIRERSGGRAPHVENVERLKLGESRHVNTLMLYILYLTTGYSPCPQPIWPNLSTIR